MYRINPIREYEWTFQFTCYTHTDDPYSVSEADFPVATDHDIFITKSIKLIVLCPDYGINENPEWGIEITPISPYRDHINALNANTPYVSPSHRDPLIIS